MYNSQHSVCRQNMVQHTKNTKHYGARHLDSTIFAGGAKFVISTPAAIFKHRVYFIGRLRYCDRLGFIHRLCEVYFLAAFYSFHASQSLVICVSVSPSFSVIFADGGQGDTVQERGKALL